MNRVEQEASLGYLLNNLARLGVSLKEESMDCLLSLSCLCKCEDRIEKDSSVPLA